MAYQATVYQIMIASPGDVNDEKRLLFKLINEWNYVHSYEKKIVLIPAAWDTHATPKMGERPQGIINEQVLDKCDLLVGIFWTKLGTPTEVADSGTVEEIEKHVGAGKPAMLYFSSEDIPQDILDTDQYKKLKAFKEKCMNEGLVETYVNLGDLKEKFARQLVQTINNDSYLKEHLMTFPVSETGEFVIDGGTFGETVEQKLSTEAEELLLDASIGHSGKIMMYGASQGLVITTNDRDLNEIGNPRSEAKWKAAVEELLYRDLIEDVGSKGVIFRLTNKGYKLADSLS